MVNALVQRFELSDSMRSPEPRLHLCRATQNSKTVTEHVELDKASSQKLKLHGEKLQAYKP